MTPALEFFHQLPSRIKGVKESKVFGSPCLKTPKGKSAAMLWKDHLIVKIDQKEIIKLAQIKGVTFFEPMKGRPMKEWLQIPFSYSDRWEELVRKSLKVVAAKNNNIETF